MASIHKNNGPNWYAAYYGPEGTRCFKSTGTADKRLALQIALQYEETAKQARAERLTMKRVRDTLSGIYASVHGEELPADETGPFLNDWLERKESELADSSLVNYQKTIEAFLDFIGPRKSKPLDSITKTIVTDWRDSLLKRVSPGTTRKQIKILRAAFNDAVREERARENPAAHVKLKQNKSQTRLPFTDMQMVSLLGAANQEWQGMILAAYTTGARLGDIASLDWDNVDLQAMEIHFSAIKTGQGMVLPLSDQLHECLIKLPSYDTGGPVFPAAKATYTRAGSSSLSKQFRKIMHDVGLAPKPNHRKIGDGRDAKRETSKYSFHCLRHSFVSNLKMSGAGDSIAKELAGHSSDAVSRIYTHGDPVALRAAVNKLPKLNLPSAKTDKTDKTP